MFPGNIPLRFDKQTIATIWQNYYREHSMKPSTARDAIFSPEQDLHLRLNPLLQTVRERKINSYFQIKNKFQEQNLKYKTMVFNPEVKVRSAIDPMYLTMQAKKTSRGPHSPEFTFKKRRADVKKKEFASMPIVQPASKIKRHLISSIDFDLIQRNLYQKNGNLTRYQLFCDRLRLKNSDPSRRKPMPVIVKVKVTINYEKEGSNQLKLKARKRFWIRPDGKKSRSMSLVNADQFVEGISINSLKLDAVKS